jgi:hypothetical protein
MPKSFGPFFGIAIAWILLWTMVWVIYRRSKGKAIIPRKPEDSVFYEGWASGHSNRSLLTKLGGAHNCLLVAVVPDALIIQPRFPFNLMFLSEIYDLEHRIPRTQIRSVRAKRGIFGKSVEVEFLNSAGDTRSFRLWLKKVDKFLAAIGMGTGSRQRR